MRKHQCSYYQPLCSNHCFFRSVMKHSLNVETCFKLHGDSGECCSPNTDSGGNTIGDWKRKSSLISKNNSCTLMSVSQMDGLSSSTSEHKASASRSWQAPGWGNNSALPPWEQKEAPALLDALMHIWEAGSGDLVLVLSFFFFPIFVKYLAKRITSPYWMPRVIHW